MAGRPSLRLTPFIPLLCLVRLRFAGFLCVPRGAGCVNDCSAYDGSALHPMANLHRNTVDGVKITACSRRFPPKGDGDCTVLFHPVPQAHMEGTMPAASCNTRILFIASSFSLFGCLGSLLGWYQFSITKRSCQCLSTDTEFHFILCRNLMTGVWICEIYAHIIRQIDENAGSELCILL